MVVLTHGTRLSVRDLPSQLRSSITPDNKSAWHHDPGKAGIPESIHSAERTMIYACLKRNNGNRTRAAEQLGISRRTLQRKLKEYQMDEADTDSLTCPTSSSDGK
jgi:two-component system response regulator HydG